jgi:hypothetical protein
MPTRAAEIDQLFGKIGKYGDWGLFMLSPVSLWFKD